MGTNASQRRPLIPSEPEHLPPLVVLLPIDNPLGDGVLQRAPVGMGLRPVRLLLVLLGIDVPAVEQLPDVLLIGGVKYSPFVSSAARKTSKTRGVAV
jgi:hypothetical protein